MTLKKDPVKEIVDILKRLEFLQKNVNFFNDAHIDEAPQYVRERVEFVEEILDFIFHGGEAPIDYDVT